MLRIDTNETLVDFLRAHINLYVPWEIKSTGFPSVSCFSVFGSFTFNKSRKKIYHIIVYYVFMDRYCSDTSNLSIHKMLIVCAIYYSVIPNSCTGFGNWICVAPKALLNFSGFFFFLGWKWKRSWLSLSLSLFLVTKSARALSDALWEPHISILSHFIWHFNFYYAARVWGKKKNKDKQVQF